MKTVFIEVSINDLKEIEKLPGFTPIFLYPKLSEIHMRAWGFIISGENEYIFRSDLHEEKIIKMTQQIEEIMLRFSGLLRCFEMGTVSYYNIQSMSERCIQAC